MIREFLHSLGIGKKLRNSFKTNDTALSRIHKDDDTLRQFDEIMRQLRKKNYSLQMPEFVLFDKDTTLLPTYGKKFKLCSRCPYQAEFFETIENIWGIAARLE